MKKDAQTNQTKPTNKSNETQTNPHKKSNKTNTKPEIAERVRAGVVVSCG